MASGKNPLKTAKVPKITLVTFSTYIQVKIKSDLTILEKNSELVGRGT